MRTIYTIKQLSEGPSACEKDSNVWHPAKPLNVKPGCTGWFKWRIKAAWHVLRGRAVPVKWV